MKQTLRLVDFFEAAIERPYLYTINGSYFEALAFLEGIMVAQSHVLGAQSLEYEIYIKFKSWLVDEMKMDFKSCVNHINENSINPFEETLNLYRLFKTKKME